MQLLNAGMNYETIILSVLILCLINLVLNLRFLMKLQSGHKFGEYAPLVSILVPARNEEGNIEACLRSLMEQDYPNYEVIVLDDNSSDSTADVVLRTAGCDNRIKFMYGEPLPEGWAGKPFACYQLARQANGEWLQFVDADTKHENHMLSSIMKIALDSKPSLISGFPRQLAPSLAQKIAIPVLYFVILGWLPLWWLQRANHRPALAIGQFLMFNKEEYWKFGGHEAVRAQILEDVWLGYEVYKNKGKHLLVDLSPVVSCTMYRDLSTMWEGFIKWMYSVVSISPFALIVMMAAGYLLYLGPFYQLWREIFVETSDWYLIVFAQVVIILSMRFIANLHFKESPVSTLLHPVGFSYLFISVIYGCIQYLIGKGVKWKERLYGESAGVR